MRIIKIAEVNKYILLEVGEWVNRAISTVSDLVNRGTSTARGTRKPIQLVIYKRGSKAREKKADEGLRRSTLCTIL